jgi:low affinity Fe/Cu permease
MVGGWSAVGVVVRFGRGGGRGGWVEVGRAAVAGLVEALRAMGSAWAGGGSRLWYRVCSCFCVSGQPTSEAAEPNRSGSRFSKVNEVFRRFASGASRSFGSPWMFILAAVVCLGWIITGPIFRYSNTWQFFINDLTNIVTFLAVFLIQNTQNRDAKEIHLKLDELLRSLKTARNRLIDLEDLSDEELDRIERQFKKLRTREAHTGGGGRD